MMTIERGIKSIYSNVYEMIFAPELDAFDKMIRRNIIKNDRLQRRPDALMSLQHIEGDNKYDPYQFLYARRVTQLKQENEILRLIQDNLTKLTTAIITVFMRNNSKDH